MNGGLLICLGDMMNSGFVCACVGAHMVMVMCPDTLRVPKWLLQEQINPDKLSGQAPHASIVIRLSSIGGRSSIDSRHYVTENLALLLFTSSPFAWDIKAKSYGATDRVGAQINGFMNSSGTTNVLMHNYMYYKTDVWVQRAICLFIVYWTWSCSVGFIYNIVSRKERQLHNWWDE